MNEEQYEIYTDASFDENTKLGTYAIIIKKEGSVIKAISKKCRIKVEKSTECEVFGVYQAMNYIAGTLLNKRKKQKFKIITDCVSAMNFFKTNSENFNIFNEEKEISFLMKNLYKKINRRLIKKNGKLEILFVERNSNKLSHKCAYSTFQQIKEQAQLEKQGIIDNKLLFINRNIFVEILTKCTTAHYEVITYLVKNIKENNLIEITQSEVASSLKMSITKINKIFKELIEIGMMEKVKNGRYALLV